VALLLQSLNSFAGDPPTAMRTLHCFVPPLETLHTLPALHDPACPVLLPTLSTACLASALTSTVATFEGCTDQAAAGTCSGSCAAGYTGSAVATCAVDGAGNLSWNVTGCSPGEPVTWLNLMLAAASCSLTLSCMKHACCMSAVAHLSWARVATAAPQPGMAGS